MARILIFADVHFKDKNLEDVRSAWSRAVSWAHKNQIDVICVAGDLFNHVNVSGKEATVGTIYEAFLAPFKTEKKPIHTVLIPGNHDIGPALEKDALAPLEGLPWISVLRKPDLYNLEDISHEQTTVPANISFCVIPWIIRDNIVARLVANQKLSTKEAETKATDILMHLFTGLEEKIAKAKKEGRFVLMLGHLEVTGAKLANGQTQAHGSFEFSPAELAKLGASAYALGHIHKRQGIPGLPNKNDGYVGTLCQLSFGEEGNSVGCRLIVIDENRKVSQDSWLDNKTSPKYINTKDLGTLEDSNFRVGVDRVKLKALVKPEVMPEGMIFEKIILQAETISRVEQKLDAGMELPNLLEAWKKTVDIDVPLEELIAGAEKLRTITKIPGDAIGSIDRIDRIALKNITCHTDTVLSLDKFKGMASLEGPNGCGKTTLIEAILVGLYGICPSRPSLSALVSQGQTEASIEIDFWSSGSKYTVKREFKVSGKTFSHKAFLFKGSETLAGPKVEEVTSMCESLVGDPSLVMAGIFSSQGEAGSLIDARPAERKDLFAKSLSTTKFLILSETAKKETQGDLAFIEANKGQAAKITVELSTEEADKAKLLTATTELATLNTDLQKTVSDLDTAKHTLSTLSSANKAYKEAVSRKANKEARLEAIKILGRDLKQQRDGLLTINFTDLESKLQKAHETQGDLAKLEAEILNAESKVMTAKNQAAQKRVQAEKLRADRSTSYSQYVVSMGVEAEKIRKVRQSKRDIFVKLHDELAAQAERASAARDTAQKQASFLLGFPDVKECKECPLAKQSISSRDGLEDLERAEKRAIEARNKSQKQLNGFDDDTKTELAQKKPVALSEWQPDVEATAQALLAEASKIEFSLPVAPDRSEERVKLKQIIDTIPNLEEKLNSKNKNALTVAKMDAQLEEKKTQYRELQKEIAGIVIPEKIDDEQQKTIVAVLQETYRQKNEKINTLTKEIAVLEARIQEYAKKKAEIESIEKDTTERKKKIKVFEALAKAFGRDGIPQLIVDSNIPRFQEIMALLLQEFDNRWGIQVKSQRMTKSGTAQEVIDILVDAGDGERDISTYSGGEKKILKSIVRIAFSTLQAERTGKGLKILVLDEATDHMDEDNSEVMVAMLLKLSSFNQVFVVSHNTRVLSTVPNRITLSIVDGEKRLSCGL